MTKEELISFAAFQNDIKDKTIELFKYIKKNFSDLLVFNYHSSYQTFRVYPRYIEIEYYNHYCTDYDYDCDYIDIGFDDFCKSVEECANIWAEKIKKKMRKDDKEVLE